MKLTGSCHCGRIKFESTGPVLRFVYCHCDDCRKTSGCAASPAIIAPASSFKLLTGEEHLAAYESSPGKERCFCRHCGSPVVGRSTVKPDIVVIRAGSLDGKVDIRPEMHIFVGVNPEWHTIGDSLPQYEGWPPA